jgi:hypothetical protein
MHINRDFKVDLCKAMEVFISAKAGQILGNFKTFLSIKVIKIVLDSILYIIKCGTKCCWPIITFSNDPVSSPSGYFSPKIL